MSLFAISKMSLFIMIKYFFRGMIDWSMTFLIILRVNIELLHWCNILFTITRYWFIWLFLIEGVLWLFLMSEVILRFRLFDKISMNGFKILSFNIDIRIIPWGIVSVFFSTSVDDHAFLILFKFHNIENEW